jgi:hypothetical protein
VAPTLRRRSGASLAARLGAGNLPSTAAIDVQTKASNEILLLHQSNCASRSRGGTYRTGGGSPPKYRMSDLNQLVTDSPTIIVATVANATAVLKDDGRFLFSNYQLNVIETIKGNFAKTDELEMKGGTYTFSDGSIVNWVEPAWKSLRTGTTYILFLHRWEDVPNQFRVVSAGQGIFEITSDGEHLISYTYIPYPYDPLIDEAKEGKDAFLKKVRSIVVATKRS